MKGGKMKNAIDWIAIVLVVIGGLNWGLVGFFDFNLVASLFGAASTISNVVYDLIGLSALWMIYYVAKE